MNSTRAAASSGDDVRHAHRRRHTIAPAGGGSNVTLSIRTHGLLAALFGWRSRASRAATWTSRPGVSSVAARNGRERDRSRHRGPHPAVRTHAELDGLRGIAVAAVFLYHLKTKTWFPGGFMASTSSSCSAASSSRACCSTRHRLCGAIAVPRFLRRRALRLLPAAFAFFASTRSSSPAPRCSTCATTARLADRERRLRGRLRHQLGGSRAPADLAGVQPRLVALSRGAVLPDVAAGAVVAVTRGRAAGDAARPDDRRGRRPRPGCRTCFATVPGSAGTTVPTSARTSCCSAPRSPWRAYRSRPSSSSRVRERPRGRCRGRGDLRRRAAPARRT